LTHGPHARVHSLGERLERKPARHEEVLESTRSLLAIGVSRYGDQDVSVYVDNAFAVGDWGRWTGGGHLQADTTDELHEFAGRLGLRREWFQGKPGRPENDHYDLGRAGRDRALALGAIDEDRAAGTRRRQGIRRARLAGNVGSRTM
jgi:hypothetical protein